jgi:predicted CXXCH cytochrome family protein
MPQLTMRGEHWNIISLAQIAKLIIVLQLSTKRGFGFHGEKKGQFTMKLIKLSVLFMAVALLGLGLVGTSYAFHSGGVAECTGCHEMHNAPGASLLKGTDISSTCLNCHENPNAGSYHISTPESLLSPGVPPIQMGPGGDFAWLKKTYIFSAHGTLTTDLGQTHGHNIVAADYNYTSDTDNATAPGGTFPAVNLACNSCHDNHGKGRWSTAGTYSVTSGAIYTSGSYGAVPTVLNGENLSTGVYRLLRTSSDPAVSGSAGANFPGTPPIAVANSTYNRSEYFSQTRTAYGSGMSGFCGGCHPDMHSTAGIVRHPSGQNNGHMPGTIVSNYNQYVKSGNMYGTSAKSFLSLVPFQEGLPYSTANINTLKGHAQTNDSQLAGPSPLAQVFCLSCHRAHASGFPDMTRWSNEGEFIVQAGLYPGTDNADSGSANGRSAAETAAGYYNYNVTKFSAYQRSLCNKCHAKD